ncbi:MAG: hypothetical protein ACRD2E_03010 [Terriglobales bacterium]
MDLDCYPAHECYAIECEALLTFLGSQGEVKHYYSRLRASSRGRDAALQEIRVAYYLHTRGFPLLRWRPQDAPGRDVEFSVRLPDGRPCFVEVKGPTWQSELSPAEIAAGRTRQSKYDARVGGAVGPAGTIQRAVKKALPKFTGRAPSLVVVADYCFVPLGMWGYAPLQMALTQASAAYGDGLFQGPGYQAVGAVALFWICRTSPVEYALASIANPNAAPSARLPQELLGVLRTEPSESAP